MISALKMRLAYSRLHRAKAGQRAEFEKLAPSFQAVYNELKAYDISRLVNPKWQANNDELEKLFTPAPPVNFLNLPTIKNTMFVEAGGRWLEEELAFLERKAPRSRLKSLLMEDLAGEPRLIDATYATSHNSIHHLYHLFRFADETGCDLGKLETVVEWGGGYGNMAKIFRRLKPATYCIVDTPLFSTLQWLYLSAVAGAGNVHLLRSPEDTIKPGRLNLVPLCFVDNLQVRADLFVSTWALSESSKASQDYVTSRRWFGAEHLLLAYQDGEENFPDADRVGEIASQTGASTVDIEFLAGSHYAFR